MLAEAAELHDAIEAAGLPEVASYAVSMAYRVRFYMEMNAREAMHVIELRTTPQGHPAYRRVGQAMHRLIAERHPAIAAAMTLRRSLGGRPRAAAKPSARPSAAAPDRPSEALPASRGHRLTPSAGSKIIGRPIK